MGLGEGRGLLKRLRLDLSCGLDGVSSCKWVTNSQMEQSQLHLDDYLKDTPKFPTVVSSKGGHYGTDQSESRI